MIKKVKGFYFSPTGTTKKIIEKIAEGIGYQLELEDITYIDKNKDIYHIDEETLLLVGVPVYGGRVPKIIIETLLRIKGGKYIVPVVVYGNRAYEDSLLELKNLYKGLGYTTIAAGAFIGEHSYSRKVGTGRPDAEDVLKALEFGKIIKEKLESNKLEEVEVSGNYPYKPDMPTRIFAPSGNNNCVFCRKCWSVCPVGAIDQKNPDKVDIEKCIHCYACIKICTFNGREVKNNPVQPIIEMLESKFTIRKEPELFF